jgi:hypothetical protein
MRDAPTLLAGSTYSVNIGSAGTVAIADASTYGVHFYNSASNWSTSPQAIVSINNAILSAEL